MSTSSPYTIRPAEEKDLPQIHSILSYYIKNTITTFRTELTSLSDEKETLETVRSYDHPYLVITSSSTKSTSLERKGEDEVVGEGDESQVEDKQAEGGGNGGEDGNKEIVHAYTYTKPFRSSKSGYLHTAELTILTRPQDVGKGFGSILLPALIENLKDDGKIKQLIAVMAVDPDEKRAEKLKGIYEGLGFEERGRLKGVGRKTGMWIDTVYLQLEL